MLNNAIDTQTYILFSINKNFIQETKIRTVERISSIAENKTRSQITRTCISTHRKKKKAVSEPKQ